jgi:predicted small integral membrane protein
VAYSGQPTYLRNELTPYKAVRELRSSSANLLVKLVEKRKVGNHIFQVMASKIWNGLSDELRRQEKIVTFVNQLKSTLCK